MTVAFPSSLPRPQRSGYGYELEPRSASTPNERGLGRLRRMGTAVQVRADLAWILTQAHLVAFAAWWRDTAAYGCEPFTIRLPTGYADQEQEVRAVGAYTATATGGRWLVKLPVELVARPVPSLATVEDAIANFALYAEASASASALHQLVHVTLPELLP